LIDPTIVALVLSAVLGYLMGSVPFGVILTKLAGAGDLRSIGSGNIGATNVLRTGRKGLAAATLLGDALKGTLAVLVLMRFGEVGALTGALFAVIGHMFPLWLGFKGGKGVATYLGVLIGVAWPVAAGFALVWIAVAAALRYSSLAALTATLLTPVAFAVMGAWPQAVVFAVLTALVWWRHSANISRLIAGSESKIGSKG